MKKSECIIKEIKKHGHRLTKIRSAMVELFSTSTLPLSAIDLKAQLLDNGVKANKTTVYRELEFLKGLHIIHDINIGDGILRFRACPGGHHHHAICTNCGNVEDIKMERDLISAEKRIERTKNFKTTHHTLEFFGLCGSCRK